MTAVPDWVTLTTTVTVVVAPEARSPSSQTTSVSRRGAGALARGGRDELRPLRELVAQLRPHRHGRAGVGHGDRVGQVLAGHGLGPVDGVGHRQVGGVLATGADIGDRRGGVVALVGVVLPAPDRGGVVHRAGPYRVHGDRDRGGVPAGQRVEGAADELVAGRADALRCGGLDQADALRAAGRSG